MKRRKIHPKSAMMSFGHEARRSYGSVKTPLYQSSTFSFETAQEGKAYFELAYGLREAGIDEKPGYIYSRISNPNLELAEQRLCLWDGAEAGAVFSSGMAAISNAMLAFLSPGDLLLFSNPVYGGTDHFIRHYLPGIGIEIMEIGPGQTPDEIASILNDEGVGDKLKMIFLETPANPTNDLFDIAGFRKLADRFSNSDQKALLVVDNTFMGPVWQQPLRHGADLVVYSATKYIGGHSDLIAGFVLGNQDLIQTCKTLRSFLGNMADPHTSWMILRSLETLDVRMERQMTSARQIADFLNVHPFVNRVYYLGLMDSDDEQYELYQKQCTAPGAMISFDIVGGEQEAFAFLNNLQLFTLAVSLGSTESLAQHPASMTHAGMDQRDRDLYGIGDSMVRLSIGLEDVGDLIADLSHAFEALSDAYTYGEIAQLPNN